ncbi:hypothetical protein T06_3675 [Trichinella sp. T6]|nr:hypothetical protein T06_3675 [Trichinella sp. T6]
MLCDGCVAPFMCVCLCKHVYEELLMSKPEENLPLMLLRYITRNITVHFDEPP